MRSVIKAAIAAMFASLALAAPASAGHHNVNPKPCGAGEPAYTGWNYYDLQSYGVACRNAHKAATEYVYDFSTEGVIEPPRHWDRCRDKEVGDRLWKGKCKREHKGKKQKITFLFTGPE